MISGDMEIGTIIDLALTTIGNSAILMRAFLVYLIVSLFIVVFLTGSTQRFKYNLQLYKL